MIATLRTLDAWLLIALIAPIFATVGAIIGLVAGHWFSRRKRLDSAARAGPMAFAEQLRRELERRDRG